MFLPYNRWEVEKTLEEINFAVLCTHLMHKHLAYAEVAECFKST